MELNYFAKQPWFSGSGIPHTFYDILNDINAELDTREIHIGTDSHASNDQWIFASVICLYQKGRGGKYFFFRYREQKKQIPNLKMRLHKEVEGSIMLASTIRDILDRPDIIVHADTSTNPVHKSFISTGSLKNFILGMGFECRFKPDAWAAAGVADKHAK